MFSALGVEVVVGVAGQRRDHIVLLVWFEADYAVFAFDLTFMKR